MSEPTTRGGSRPVRAHSAGAFDVRNVIAGLIGFYGVVLTIYGLVDSAEDSDKTGGVDANLWTGLAMLVFAASFALWSWLRPIVVDPTDRAGEDGPGDGDDERGARP